MLEMGGNVCVVMSCSGERLGGATAAGPETQQTTVLIPLLYLLYTG